MSLIVSVYTNSQNGLPATELLATLKKYNMALVEGVNFSHRTKTLGRTVYQVTMHEDVSRCSGVPKCICKGFICNIYK